MNDRTGAKSESFEWGFSMRSRFAMLLLGVIGIGILIGGTTIATDGGIPTIGGGDDRETETPTAEPQPNATATSTRVAQTSTPTSSPTATPTESTEPSDLHRFKSNLRERLEFTAENDTLTGVPPLALQYRETSAGRIELWLVYRQCDTAEATLDQFWNTGVAYAYTVGNVDGRQADRLVVYAINKLETYNDSIARISRTSAVDLNNGSIGPVNYTKKWTESLKEPTDSESNIAFRMTVNESGRSKAEQAFHEHYPLEESDRGCPGAVERGDSS